MVARAAEPVVSATAESTVGQGGWAGTTTVQPRQGGDPAWGQNGAAGGGWGGADSGASWQADTRSGVAGGVAGAPVGGGYGAGQGGVGGGFGQPAPQASTGGWGDTSGGRVGEVLPPGVPYPGTENGAHSDALASLDQARRQPAPQVAPQAVAPGGVASGSGLHGAEAAYEQAYGLLLQQDYGAAQFSFQEFLKQHPGSPLAGNAQYWLGEIHYVQGQYKEAARAFLTGYEQYGDGNKAADSLLKLALSLDKLNQAQAACSSLSEFFKRYGGTGEAPVEQANEVRQRLRCRS
jgi:tol-pal system protein YbgF